MHVPLRLLDPQRIEELLLLLGAERAHCEHLRLAAGEERRAVGTRQDTDLNPDLPDLVRPPAVGSLAALEDRLADQALHQRVEQLAHLLGRRDGLLW
jgi:hypothetical protein